MTNRVVAVIALALSMFGCATDDQIAGCREILSEKVTVRLLDQFSDEIDGERANFGRFELFSHYNGSLKVTGWQRAAGFLIVDPIARVELWRGQKWTDVLTTMGSWMTTGDHALTVKYQEKYVLLARLDYGIPEGKHEMRLVVQANDGLCFVSDSFFSEVKKTPS